MLKQNIRNEQDRIPVFRTISWKVLLIITLNLAVIVLLTDLFYYNSEKTRIMNNFNESYGGNLRKLALVLRQELSLGTVPGQTFHDYFLSEMTDSSIKSLNVTDNTGKTLLEVSRNNGEISFSSTKSMGPDDKVFNIQILNNDRLLGNMHMVVSTAAMTRTLSELFIEMSLFSILLTLFALFVITLFIKRFILHPVSELNRAVERLTGKDFTVRAEVHYDDELGMLSRNFNKLVDTLKVYEEETLRQMFTDALTGLSNRQKIMLDIEQAEEPTLVLMNIDSFKEINDCYGNVVGDRLLKELAHRLKHHQPRFVYQLYRMSGDEFALLFDMFMEGKEIEKTIRVISGEIEDHPFMAVEHEVHLRVTFGIARGKDLESRQLMEGRWKHLATNADMALKQAKRSQKPYVIYKDTLKISQEYKNNLFWKKKLKEAINGQRIVPYFQPIINNYTGEIEKYETLVRMIDRVEGVVSPAYFLDVAKKTQLYGCITRAVLSKSIDVFSTMPFEFSINLTIKDILDEEINRFIVGSVMENKGVAPRIVFEILESEGIENYEEVIHFIKSVKNYGCKIAIDDFGAGYSNFEHLMRLDVDYIKIDASLIKNLVKDRNAQVITKTIASIAKELGLKTISEHVSSREIYEKSVSLGVDFSQGFYFGQPQDSLLASRHHVK